MKSSDYFSKVYEPKQEMKRKKNQSRTTNQASIRFEIEMMLDWLYNSTNDVFECIPESTLKSFAPDEISFRFFHNASREYVLVQLIKYLEGVDQFYCRNKATKTYEIAFKRKFSSVPEYYRKNWDDPITKLRKGNFETEYTPRIASQLFKAGINKTAQFGKYKAIFSFEIEYGEKFEKFIKKM